MNFTLQIISKYTCYVSGTSASILSFSTLQRAHITKFGFPEINFPTSYLVPQLQTYAQRGTLLCTEPLTK